MDELLACLPEAERLAFADRLERIELPQIEHGITAGEQIDAMTSGDRSAGDSLHLIVMDAHRAINRLQAATATETLSGARVSGLSAGSKLRVAAFMEGLNRTAPLKFDHPGLGTTAEHAGRLLIQNDIGTTDAHVLVIASPGSPSVTYTDVHLARLEFFQSLLGFEVGWEGTQARRSDSFEKESHLLRRPVRAADERS